MNSEPGALGQELAKLFTVLRRRIAEEGTVFGKVTDGDLHVVELGSWLQPSKADYYLQRLSAGLSVMLVQYCSASGRRPMCRSSCSAREIGC